MNNEYLEIKIFLIGKLRKELDPLKRAEILKALVNNFKIYYK
jgi:hypothetical protein